MNVGYWWESQKDHRGGQNEGRRLKMFDFTVFKLKLFLT
jgi:hypothetical protein